jgi:hypothetical protein
VFFDDVIFLPLPVGGTVVTRLAVGRSTISNQLVARSVGNLKDGCVRNVPLPRAPRVQSASHVTCYGAITRDGSTPLHSTPLAYVPTYVRSTPLAYIPAAPRIQSTCHVTCYGAITHDGSTPLHSTPLAYEPTYLRSTPLAYVPAAPRIQSGGHVTSHGPVTRDEVPEPDTCYLQVPRVPTWSGLIRSLTGLGRCPRIIPFSPVWLL